MIINVSLKTKQQRIKELNNKGRYEIIQWVGIGAAGIALLLVAMLAGGITYPY